ncbi:MAG: MBL fold metallo-hydrolase [Caldilineales bacterium]|nr:MBL fold metallo-hydrolase [Caldilineales bacterium]
MEISWYGLACFRLRTRGLTIITDPFDPKFGWELPKLRGEVATISHDAPGHNCLAALRKPDHVFAGPGEYEVNGVFITGVPTYHKGEVGQRERNTAFVFEYPDITICHLGDMGVLPAREQVELLSGADVLLLPVGGGAALDAAKAVEIVTELEPSIVVPMHYALPGLHLDLDPVEKFLKEMGVPRPEPIPVLKTLRSELGSEETRVILLEPQRA